MHTTSGWIRQYEWCCPRNPGADSSWWDGEHLIKINRWGGGGGVDASCVAGQPEGQPACLLFIPTTPQFLFLFLPTRVHGFTVWAMSSSTSDTDLRLTVHDWRHSGLVCGCRPVTAYPDRSFCAFPHALWANAGIVSSDKSQVSPSKSLSTHHSWYICSPINSMCAHNCTAE